MPKLGIFGWFTYPLALKERFEKIKQAGFEAISLWGGNNRTGPESDLARKLGFEIDNVHAPFDGRGPDAFWTDCLDGHGYFEMLTSLIGDCKYMEISTMVTHITGFGAPPEISTLGLDRVKRLVDLAERQGVNLALENLNDLKHLDHIFANIDWPRLGFCYDSGHENRFHPDADCLSRYGQKLFAVHLDDNFGDSDTHLLPYDGAIDWEKTKKKLCESKKIGCMTLEVDFDPKHEKSAIYKDLSADKFLALAYERAKKLVDI